MKKWLRIRLSTLIVIATQRDLVHTLCSPGESSLALQCFVRKNLCNMLVYRPSMQSMAVVEPRCSSMCSCMHPCTPCSEQSMVSQRLERTSRRTRYNGSRHSAHAIHCLVCMAPCGIPGSTPSSIHVHVLQRVKITPHLPSPNITHRVQWKRFTCVCLISTRVRLLFVSLWIERKDRMLRVMTACPPK